MKLAICTGGGDCPGLNGVIRAVVKTQYHKYNCEVVGIYDSLDGILENPPKANILTVKMVEEILYKGGTILGSKSKGNPIGLKDKSDSNTRDSSLKKIKQNLKKLKIDGLIVVGGEGTQESASYLSENGIPVLGIPKTIDNDLPLISHPVGFNTAVSICADSITRLKETYGSSKIVNIVEVMGRNSGYLAIHSGLATGSSIILLPEIPYDLSQLVAKISCLQKDRDHAILIVVSEGIHPKGAMPQRKIEVEGKAILKGASRLLGEQLRDSGIESTETVLGHIQRGGQPDAFDRILASIYGSEVVDYAHRGEFGYILSYEEGQIKKIPYSKMTGEMKVLELSLNSLVTSSESSGIFLGR